MVSQVRTTRHMFSLAMLEAGATNDELQEMLETIATQKPRNAMHATLSGRRISMRRPLLHGSGYSVVKPIWRKEHDTDNNAGHS